MRDPEKARAPLDAMEVESELTQMYEEFIEDGTCDIVSEFAVPLPLYVIGRQMGVPESDLSIKLFPARAEEAADRVHAGRS
jgi:cytochrome P450